MPDQRNDPPRPDRRTALHLLGGSAVAFGLGLRPHPATAASPLPDIATVSGGGPAANVRQAIELLGGIGRFVSSGDRVVLKPNMGFGNPPAHATTTEPAVVRAVAELALAAGARRVIVTDYPCHNPGVVLEVCGVRTACEGLRDTHVYTPSEERLFRETIIPGGRALTSQKVLIDVLEADCLINLPVAKSHGATGVSFGMKNWMGVVLNRSPWHRSYDLHQAIADFAAFIKPRLTILDATRVLQSGGPAGPGKVLPLDRVVAGTDPVAVDAFGLSLSEFDGRRYSPADVRHIALAAERGVGTSDLSRLSIARRTA